MFWLACVQFVIAAWALLSQFDRMDRVSKALVTTPLELSLSLKAFMKLTEWYWNFSILMIVIVVGSAIGILWRQRVGGAREARRLPWLVFGGASLMIVWVALVNWEIERIVSGTLELFRDHPML